MANNPFGAGFLTQNQPLSSQQPGFQGIPNVSPPNPYNISRQPGNIVSTPQTASNPALRQQIRSIGARHNRTMGDITSPPSGGSEE